MSAAILPTGSTDAEAPVHKLARELAVGDYIVTAIGTAPVTAIEPDHGGLAVHLDFMHERSTRPAAETHVLWLYTGQQVAVLGRDTAPALNPKRLRARECPPAFLRRPTGRGYGKKVAA